MTSTRNIVLAIAVYIPLGAEALAQMAAPEPERRVSVLVIVLSIAVVLLAAVAVAAIVRRAQAPKPYRPETKPEELASAAKPARQPIASEPDHRQTKGIFISYRRADSADITGRIYDRIAQHFGEDTVFKDVDSIPLGIDFQKHLQEAVSQCSVLLAIIGRSWLDTDAESKKRRLDDPRDHLRIEIETALRRNIPVIPVLVQGGAMPAEADLPLALQPLAYRNGTNVRPDPDFHPDMNRLIKGIEAHLR